LAVSKRIFNCRWAIPVKQSRSGIIDTHHTFSTQH
jgi:hypothetical protein